jgi:hypothetical protein
VRARLAARAFPRLLGIASSAACLAACSARHRLVWLPSCLLRGTTRLHLAAARGTTRLLFPAPESLRHWACTPSAAPPVPVCLLEAPPTGGTHLESNEWIEAPAPGTVGDVDVDGHIGHGDSNHTKRAHSGPKFRFGPAATACAKSPRQPAEGRIS